MIEIRLGRMGNIVRIRFRDVVDDDGELAATRDRRSFPFVLSHALTCRLADVSFEAFGVPPIGLWGPGPVIRACRWIMSRTIYTQRSDLSTQRADLSTQVVKSDQI